MNATTLIVELWLLAEKYGQCAVQAIMADAFAPCPDFTLSIAHELSPSTETVPAVLARPMRVPAATVDAFKYVVGLGDPEYLARWLRDHSDVAQALLKEVG